MTGPFDGAGVTAPEPRVGEIRAVRTFRLSSGGLLLPVFMNAAWADGVNTARCDRGHVPAEPGCHCGFWAYSTRRAASSAETARKLLAVVDCWGRVVPGTHGLRAQQARITAIWVSRTVPRARVARMRKHYPSAHVCASRRVMLRRYPLTWLDSYCSEPLPKRRGYWAGFWLESRDRFAYRRADAIFNVVWLAVAVPLLVLFEWSVVHLLWPGTVPAWWG